MLITKASILPRLRHVLNFTTNLHMPMYLRDWGLKGSMYVLLLSNNGLKNFMFKKTAICDEEGI